MFHTGTLHVPYFAWYGHKADYNILKIWGEPGIAHDDNNKLAHPGTKVYWVGYGNHDMTHLLCNPHVHKIVTSQHFRFD